MGRFADKVTVEIYDMLGRLIFSNSYPPSQNVNVILDDFTVVLKDTNK
jgi:hypothetical protein